MIHRASFKAGISASLPYQLAICFFGILTGALMAEGGLSLFETVAMTLIVLSGAAQLAAIQMMVDNASVLVILITCVFINARFGMYSAALAPYFSGMPKGPRYATAILIHDQSFAVSLARFQTIDEDWRARMWFCVAAGGFTSLVWSATTAAGHMLGTKAPDWMAIDFAMPLVFIGMTVPFLRDKPRWLAAVVASGSALALRGLPLDLGLLVATALGIAAGYWAETRREQP